MRITVLIVFLITCSASRLREDGFMGKFFVVWNIGQGQWTTAVSAERCLHFDIGGEFFPLRQARTLCAGKPNAFYLSHWDWDHIGGLARWKRPSCLALAPLGKSSESKQRLLNKLHKCSDKFKDVFTWSPGLPRSKKKSNEASHVVMFRDFLLPGDSTIQQEKLWALNKTFHSAQVLLLGHHGSRTSTSEELLMRLPRLKQAVVSARWKRYFHPHAQVIALLNRHRIPMIRTEDWGNIWFEH